MKILAIVPAYNEQSNILNVIKSLKAEYPNIDILVVNDGSEDDTGSIAEKTGQAEVINLPCNLGIGGAVQTGFKYAMLKGYDYAFQFDGDSQHNASEIHKITEPLLKNEADVIIGSRFCGEKKGYTSTFLRKIGIKIFSIINSFLIRQTILDNTSGFRAYNKRAIQFFANYYPTDYPEPEAIILLDKNNFKMKEVSIKMMERRRGKSSIKGFNSLYYMIKVILAILITYTYPKNKTNTRGKKNV